MKITTSQVIRLLWIFTVSASNRNNKTDLFPRLIDEFKQARQEKQLYIEYRSKLARKDSLLLDKEFFQSEKCVSILIFSNTIAVIVGFYFIGTFILSNLTNTQLILRKNYCMFFASH